MLKYEAVYYLYLVYQYQSVKLAAESVPVSPSTVSGAIHKLEKEWGFPLLVRNYRGIELTEHANRIALVLKDFFLEAQKVENAILMEQTSLKQLPNTPDKLTLLMSRGWWQGATKDILPYLLSKGANVDIPDILSENEKLLEKVNLTRNTIFLNSMYEPIEDVLNQYTNIEYKRISSGAPGVLVARDSKWVPFTKKYLLPEEVIQLPILRFTEGFEAVFEILERLEEYGSLHIVENISNIQVLLAMLEADIGVCIAYDDKRMKYANEKYRFIPIKTEDRISLLFCCNRDTQEGYKTLIECMLNELF